VPITFEFYQALAIIAALLLGVTALLPSQRGAAWGTPARRRAALHFTVPLLVALAVLLPPYGWLPPVAPLPLVYFWQVALVIAAVLLIRAVPRLVVAGRVPRRFYGLAAVYLLLALLALLSNIVFNLSADILTLIAFALLGHLFAGLSTLLAGSEG
jgi:hypothetical protein